MVKIKFWMLSIFTISVLLVSCGKTVDESALVAEYLESADSPVALSSLAQYITAENVKSLMATDGAYIIDIRSEADFKDIGHIEGAINLPAGDVISHLETADIGDKQVVITCYTGQTAAFVTSLVNMSYPDITAKSLKWGMSSWNDESAGPLKSNSGNAFVTDFNTTDNPKAEAGDLPVIETGFETATEILDAQITEVNASGFSEAAVSATEVFANLDNYYIVNYWPKAHYDLNHVPGAIQYTPGEDLLTTSFLKTLPTDKTVVVYCYTGQTSAFVTAYLKVLGYDCKSLKFGVNGMATDWATENGLPHWSNAEIKNYTLIKN